MSNKRDIIIGRAFAISAAVAYGITSVLIRRGVAELASPLAGATIALLSGTLILSIMGVRSPESNLREKKRAVGLLLIAGVASGLGIVASFFALSMAPVVVVSPLQGTNPLFALLWSHFFLGQLERITPRVMLGTFLVIAGATLITIGRVA